ncbi:unnamed protein product [Moneuplotes crassus]|uniref:Uncharacterized protein n=1 Tax=Euplotes crassus TaxID=5936 RepID=A0AAD1UIZ0_EUPCR|nr:unnamed protein product [Moneuplotes crassus]
MKLNRTSYFNSLIRISSKVIRVATFSHFCLNLSQLKRLIAAYRHVERLDICCCELSIPTAPDFSKALQNCQIEEINLLGTGSYSYKNWRDHPEEFNNLIQGFARSTDLRTSLRKVNIKNCCIKQSEAEEIFAKNQIRGVTIIGGI